MLNCCIERKRARDEAHREGSKGKGSTSSTAGSSSTREAPLGRFRDSGSDSEEEFFECLSDQEEIESSQSEGGRNGGKGKAEGRLHPYNNMTLLNSTEALYVPVTQVELDQNLQTHTAFD